MRTYIIPPTMKGEREKIIGGILDIVQAAWIMFGAIIGVAIFLMLAPISKVLGIVLGAPIGITIAAVFGFVKIKGYSILKYFKYKRKFKAKQKKLINKRNYK